MADDIIKPDPSYDINGTGPSTGQPAPTTAPANDKPLAPMATPETVGVAPTNAPVSTPAPIAAQTTVETPAAAEDRRRAAMLAMEGPERTARREEQEKTRQAREQKHEFEERLNQIAKQKEKLELGWIDLDEQRKKLKATLAPILEQEKQVQAEEVAAEEEEEKTGLPKEKHLVEEKRWVIQQKRKQIEDEKWKTEEKVVKLEEAIEANTNEYRSILDEEEKIHIKIDEINTSVL